MYYQIRSKTCFTARISEDKNPLATPELFLGLSIIYKKLFMLSVIKFERQFQQIYPDVLFTAAQLKEG